MVKDDQPGPDGVGLPVGSKIGKYEVRQRIAIGGQAIVYKAYDSLLDRYVAVKQISSALVESPKFVERFRKEAQILARLGEQEPAIVTIHELLEDERGLFIVTEFIEGRTIEAILDESGAAADPKMVLQILWRLAAALNAVHKAGIIHRDIKPSNIIITEALRPKITDFGVAGTASGQTSMLLGTTKYMAPEIFAGAQLDGRADIYSLGMIAYEMLTGRNKFNQIFADVVRDKHTEPMRWMKWHSEPEAVAPPLGEVVPDVPWGVADVVARMLQKDPNDRFEDTEALGRAIKAASSAQLAGPAPQILAPSSAGTIEPGAIPAQQAPSVDTTPTAPIPRTPVSLQTKLLIAGILASVVIAAAATMAYVYYRSKDRLVQQAQTVYELAERHYQEGSYAKAMEEFVKLNNPTLRKTQLAAQASVREALCRAHLAVQQASESPEKDVADLFWREASKAQEEAKRANQRIQSRATVPSLITWTRGVATEIEEFNEYRLDAWTFSVGMVKARGFFGEGQFGKALGELEAIGISGAQLTVQQQEELSKLTTHIRVAKFKTLFENHLRRGDSHVEAVELDKAQEAYRSAGDMLETQDAETLLSQQQRAAYGEDFAAKLVYLENMRRYHDALAQADAARSDGDQAAELSWVQKAHEANPTEPVKQRLDALRFQITLQRARELKVKWDEQHEPELFVQAREAYTEALAIKEDPSVRAELDALIKAGHRAALIQAADVATEEAKFENALDLYAQARQLGEDEQLRDRIRTCLYQQQLFVADALRDQKRYDQAEQAYREALQKNPDAAAQIDARIETVGLLRKYDDLVADAGRYLAAHGFTRALALYRDAGRLIDNAGEQGRIDPQLHERLIGQIAELKNQAKYEKFIYDGKEAMNRRNYSGARANFNQAKELKDTEEVRKLLAELERLGSESP